MSNENWKDKLPESYLWAKKVSLNTQASAASKCHNLIVVKKAGKDDYTILANNAPENIAAIFKGNNKSWSGTDPLTLVAEDGVYTFINRSDLAVEDIRKDRQIGIDFTKAMRQHAHLNINVWEANEVNSLHVIEGLFEGTYDISFFKGSYKANLEKLPNAIAVVGGDYPEQAFQEIRSNAQASGFGRFLQDCPANYLNPEKWAEIAEDFCKENQIKYHIHDQASLEKLNMNSMLSVAAGSQYGPRMIVMEFEGSDNSKSIALIGKGLTFDAGGISLKPAAGMDEMKYDMSGGAAVMGAAHYFAQNKPAVKTYCIIGAVENMPGGKATKPGDIVTAMNGKSIEILNTDAEGRLVLADILCYADMELKADYMINLATLTGAVLIGLGSIGCAVMSNDQQFADTVIKSATATGEPIWQLPMWPELQKEVKSPIADLKNIAKPNVKAGTIVAGAFLSEFVGERKWAHMDIAGTAWCCQALGYPSTGGSGYGVRTIVETTKNI